MKESSVGHRLDLDGAGPLYNDICWRQERGSYLARAQRRIGTADIRRSGITLEAVHALTCRGDALGVSITVSVAPLKAPYGEDRETGR